MKSARNFRISAADKGRLLRHFAAFYESRMAAA
jgi:hypothetical protein